MERLRRHPLLLGLLSTAISLLAAIGVAAAYDRTRDEPRTAKPELELRFGTGDQDATEASNPLVSGGLPAGSAAPAATFELLAGGLGTLEQRRGKPLVLNFWASTCAPCVDEMPAIERVHQALGDRVGFLGLSVFEGRAPAEDMVRSTGVTYDIGRDPSGSIASSFEVLALPATVLLRADGTIAELHRGALTDAALRALIETKLLS